MEKVKEEIKDKATDKATEKEVATETAKEPIAKEKEQKKESASPAKKEFAELINELKRRYPQKEEMYRTSDKQVFFTKSDAQFHQNRIEPGVKLTTLKLR